MLLQVKTLTCRFTEKKKKKKKKRSVIHHHPKTNPSRFLSTPNFSEVRMRSLSPDKVGQPSSPTDRPISPTDQPISPIDPTPFLKKAPIMPSDVPRSAESDEAHTAEENNDEEGFRWCIMRASAMRDSVTGAVNKWVGTT